MLTFFLQPLVFYFHCVIIYTEYLNLYWYTYTHFNLYGFLDINRGVLRLSVLCFLVVG